MNSDQSVNVSKIEVIENEINTNANNPSDADEKIKEIEPNVMESQAQDSEEIVTTTETATTETDPVSAIATTETPTTPTTTTSIMKTIPTAITLSMPTKPIEKDIENEKSKSGEKEKESEREKEKEVGKGKEKDKGKDTSESSIVTPDYIQQSMRLFLVYLI